MTLVCGGGGLWGIAWLTGIAAGLADAGVDLRNATTFIGTSAGSVIASQLASGLDIETLFARQADPAAQGRELAPPAGALEALIQVMSQPWPDETARLHALRDLAKTVRTVPSEVRRAVVAARLGLPPDRWPEKKLTITAMDLDRLDLTIFTAENGVSLADAVAASCAVPGIWPPVQINGSLYADGGAWKTAENAHLAQGAETVLIFAPLALGAGAELGFGAGLTDDIAALRTGGSEVILVAPDQPSRATMGRNPLDPSTRQPGAAAGRVQGATLAPSLRHLF